MEKSRKEFIDKTFIPTPMDTSDFNYAISVFQLAQTIFYYYEEHIKAEDKIKGMTMWDYLCEIEKPITEKKYHVIKKHREQLGFPVDENGESKLTSRTLQRIMSGERSRNSEAIVQEFYSNKNFMEYYQKCREIFTDRDTLQETINKYPKVSNKLNQILESVEFDTFRPVCQFKNKREFIASRIDNLDEYNQKLDNLNSHRLNKSIE